MAKYFTNTTELRARLIAAVKKHPCAFWKGNKYTVEGPNGHGYTNGSVVVLGVPFTTDNQEQQDERLTYTQFFPHGYPDSLAELHPTSWRFRDSVLCRTNDGMEVWLDVAYLHAISADRKDWHHLHATLLVGPNPIGPVLITVCPNTGPYPRSATEPLAIVMPMGLDARAYQSLPKTPQPTA